MKTDKIAKRLLEQREKLRYNQTGIADVANVSQRTFSSWENGVLPGQWKSLIALAEKFGVSTDYLLGLTDDPRPVSTPTTPQHIDEDQAAVLEMLANLPPDEQKFVKDMIQFVGNRNTPRIIGGE